PRRRGLPEITLPRWQPDAEVTYCPICHQQFSFLVRKHHCRKCGRVVCASCSPHRITIPHQYIVRPPGDMSRLRASVLFGEEGGVADFSAIGGGERVRLCNPCVPDPNTTPPHAQRSPGTDLLQPRSVHHRSHSSASGTGNAGNLIGNAPNDAGSRSRSATLQYSSSHRAGSRGVPSLTQNLTQNRILSGTPPTYYPYPSGYASSSSSRYQPPAQPHYQSLLDNLAASSSSSAASRNNRPLPPPPPQQIPEEDECPVCHRELPSQRLPNFEALRESHITTCITQHSTYGPPAATSNQLGAHGTPPQRIARRTGMFPYAATEKDCVDSAECTICLEEFSVGVPMARLECLCRFHRSCIEAWFVNHPGRCPVHQHDSFGY
ncbi:FYVE zinc finger-domain-containing protein, partial [Pseudomassariella vexata]